MYLSALVELGLVLFLLTMVINALAQLLILVTTKKGVGKVMISRSTRRHAINNIMLTTSGVCAFLTVSTLFVILAYLVYNGGKSVNLDFFTKLPLAPGRDGRRHGQCHRWQRRNRAARYAHRTSDRFFFRRISGRIRR